MLTFCQPSRGSKLYVSPRECALEYLLSDMARTVVAWLVAVMVVKNGEMEETARRTRGKIVRRVIVGRGEIIKEGLRVDE
jgi:hypothetical protein